MLPARLEGDLSRIRNRATAPPRRLTHAEQLEHLSTNPEYQYATLSSIDASFLAARDMHAAAVRLKQEDADAAKALECKASELFDRGRRCRDIFRRRTQLIDFVSRPSLGNRQLAELSPRAAAWLQPVLHRSGSLEDAAMEKALADSLKEFELAEARRACLHKQLEKWGYVERPVPDDNNCQVGGLSGLASSAVGAPSSMRLLTNSTLTARSRALIGATSSGMR